MKFCSISYFFESGHNRFIFFFSLILSCLTNFYAGDSCRISGFRGPDTSFIGGARGTDISGIGWVTGTGMLNT